MENGYSGFCRSIAMNSIKATQAINPDTSAQIEGEVLRQDGNLMLVKGTGVFGEEYLLVVGGRCAAHYLDLKVAEKHYAAALDISK